MKEKLKIVFRKHFNCIPWLLCGISVVADGEVKMYQYILVLLALLILIWIKLPIDDMGDK